MFKKWSNIRLLRAEDRDICSNSGTYEPRAREVSSTPRDLTDEQCAPLIPDTDEPFMKDSKTTQIKWQPNRVNPLPMTLRQLMQAQKVRRLLRDKLCRYRNQEFLWPVARDHDMLLILLPWHGTLWVYFCELRDFMVSSVTFLLFARYYGILCRRV